MIASGRRKLRLKGLQEEVRFHPTTYSVQMAPERVGEKNFQKSKRVLVNDHDTSVMNFK